MKRRCAEFVALPLRVWLMALEMWRRDDNFNFL